MYRMIFDPIQHLIYGRIQSETTTARPMARTMTANPTRPAVDLASVGPVGLCMKDPTTRDLTPVCFLNLFDVDLSVVYRAPVDRATIDRATISLVVLFAMNNNAVDCGWVHFVIVDFVVVKFVGVHH